MRIGIPKETAGGEKRVAMVPDVVRKLDAAGHEVLVERGAGERRRSPTPRSEGGRRRSATRGAPT